MTVTNTDSSVTQQGNGVTTIWPFDFLIPTGTEQVTLTDLTTGLEGAALDESLYSITGTDDENGGTVTYPLVGSPLSNLFKITIRRNEEPVQELNLTSQSGYNPVELENTLDKIVRIEQQILERVLRAVTIAPGSALTAEELLTEIMQAAVDAAASEDAAAASAIAAAASAAAAATFNPALFAALAGAAFTGAVTGLTRPAGDSTTNFATTAFLQTEILPELYASRMYNWSKFGGL